MSSHSISVLSYGAPPAPSVDDCRVLSEITWRGHTGRACFYPSSGNDKALAIVFPGAHTDYEDRHDGCDVFVWDGSDKPVRLHHCIGREFIEFGLVVDTLNNQLSAEDAPRVDDFLAKQKAEQLNTAHMHIDTLLWHLESMRPGLGAVKAARRYLSLHGFHRESQPGILTRFFNAFLK